MGKVHIKPKVNLSSYVHFLLNCRNKHKEQQPNAYINFKEFSKKCSEKWKTISKHEKSKYEAIAKLDKARYQKEMKNYVPPAGMKRKKRRKKDPKAPKRPPSSFILFSRENYTKIKGDNPHWSVIEVAKFLGEMWSKKSEQEKQPYEEKAARLRTKYHQELTAYRVNYGQGCSRKKGPGTSGQYQNRKKSKSDKKCEKYDESDSEGELD
ncbi:high mobility group protein B4 [Gracilinanus agilis]|uniref:high mobility group protein B4 n=1 Tax=Gracilinanus agilis TaxID=191870 RepID=UPI001CFD2BE8|nr:high mobility group protein B4 [Gracilinanus agilis]